MAASLRLTVILILTASFTTLTARLTSLHAQELTASEFTALKGYKIEKIDSLMIAKGFTKEKTDKQKDFTLIIYTYRKVGRSSFIQRTLHLGWQPAVKTLDIQYGVWQQDEATKFIDLLQQEGYRKTTNSVPNLDGTSTTDIVYKKGPSQITYQTQQYPKTRLHIYSISNENYTP